MLTRLRDRLADLLERPIVGRVLRLLGVAVVTAGVSGLGVYGVCNYHAGHLYRVNPSGEVFLRARGDGLDRPVLTGLDDRLVEQYGPVARRIVLDALHILDLVGESGVIQPDDLSELHFDEALGFTLLLRNGGLLRFGFRDPAQQLLRLGVMARNGLDLSVPHHIDLDLDGLAVATPLSS